MAETPRRSKAEGVLMKKEKTESREVRARRAMCESLSRSAEKLVSMAIFLAGTNGITGCVVNPERGIPRSYVENETGLVADDLPITYEEMREGLNGALETEDNKLWRELYVHEQRLAAVKELHRNEQKHEVFPEIGNFEKYGIDQELFKQYLSTYPKTWVDRDNIQEIVIDPDYGPAHEGGNVYGQRLACYHLEIPGTSKLIITNEAFKQAGTRLEAIKHLLQTSLPHELVHANSWMTSPELNQKQSIELMYRVWQATTAEKRPRRGLFAYPETIPKEKMLLRMAEFYAVLMQEALSFSRDGINSWETWENEFAGYMKVEDGADQEQAGRSSRIVRRYFSFTESGFKPWIAAKERTKMTEKILSEAVHTRFLETLQSVDDIEMRHLLEHVLNSNRHSPPMQEGFGERVYDEFGNKAYSVFFEGFLLYKMAFAIRQGRVPYDSVGQVIDQFRVFNDGLSSLKPEMREKIRKAVLDYGKIMLTAE